MLLLLCIGLAGLAAGVLGAILGLGGGVVVVPALGFLASQFGVALSLQQAIAISQIGVLSVGLASTVGYLKQGLIQVRLGYLLAPFTVLGGIAGSYLGRVLPEHYVALVFAVLLLYSSYALIFGAPIHQNTETDRPKPGLQAAMGLAGIMSGLLGIGGGTIQVPVLNILAGLPIRVAIATSTFVMGLTAVGNALVYQAGGLLNTHYAVIVALGILIGARLGTHLQKRISTVLLKRFFAVLLIYTAASLLWKYWI